jgi:hypothetical protein
VRFLAVLGRFSGVFSAAKMPVSRLAAFACRCDACLASRRTLAIVTAVVAARTLAGLRGLPA